MNESKVKDIHVSQSFIFKSHEKSDDIHAFTLLIQEFNMIITFPKIDAPTTYRVKSSYSKAWRTFIKIQFSKHL